MSYSTIEFETGPAPDAAVIWMHGFGAGAQGMAGMARTIDYGGFAGGVRCLFPQAPVITVDAEDGMRTASWYNVIHTAAGRVPEPRSLETSRLEIERLIEGQVAAGIASRRIVLAGFSQGGAMALYAGLRCARNLGGVMCLSGRLRLPEALAAQRHAANAATPILMAHGTRDDKIPLEQAEESRALLRALGYAVDWREYDMVHSVVPREILDIGDWLRSVLAV
jgi:phospholipase/carboxylesterase